MLTIDQQKKAKKEVRFQLAEDDEENVSGRAEEEETIW